VVGVRHQPEIAMAHGARGRRLHRATHGGLVLPIDQVTPLVPFHVHALSPQESALSSQEVSVCSALEAWKSSSSPVPGTSRNGAHSMTKIASSHDGPRFETIGEHDRRWHISPATRAGLPRARQPGARESDPRVPTLSVCASGHIIRE
jgi:hypothetical protein